MSRREAEDLYDHSVPPLDYRARHEPVCVLLKDSLPGGFEDKVAAVLLEASGSILVAAAKVAEAEKRQVLDCVARHEHRVGGVSASEEFTCPGEWPELAVLRHLDQRDLVT